MKTQLPELLTPGYWLLIVSVPGRVGGGGTHAGEGSGDSGINGDICFFLMMLWLLNSFSDNVFN